MIVNSNITNISSLNILLNASVFSTPVQPDQLILFPVQKLASFVAKDYNLAVTNIQQYPFNIAPNASLTIFNTSETTNISATTTFNLNYLGNSNYQISSSGGPNPGFRTLRSINLGADSQISVTINNASLVTYQVVAGTSITTSTVNSGDILYVDPSSPFTAGNQGSFTVISSTTNSISVQNSNAVGQTVTLGAPYASQFKVFSAAGVQVNDTMVVSAGFNPSVFGNYQVYNVTDNAVWFTSTLPLPTQSSIAPGASGLTFYSAAPFYMLAQGNQTAKIITDSNTLGDTVQPISCGLTQTPWLFVKTGASYQLIIKNLNNVNWLNGSLLLAQAVI